MKNLGRSLLFCDDHIKTQKKLLQTVAYQNDWTLDEVRALVEDYFRMLHLELTNHKYNKSEFRRALVPLLNNRTESAIEKKRQNVSASLVKMGLPYIKGYVPLYNYQKELVDGEVARYISLRRQSLEHDFNLFANSSKTLIKEWSFQDVIAAPPSKPDVPPDDDLELKFRPIKINYLKREQNNRSLGEQGEEFVLHYERWRLINEGKISLAESV